MAGDSNKPNMRMIAKRTDSRQDRYSDVGVAWTKKDDDGRTIVSIKLNPFVSGELLQSAASLLLVPFERARPAPGATGDAPADPAYGAPPPGDDDAPSW